MNQLIQLTKTSSLSVISLLLVCVAIPSGQNAFGVIPPPDGGYPNFTTAEGTNALKNLTSGAGNTGVGWHSLFIDTTASFNTALGVGTLLFNNADENTAVGAATLLFNTAAGNTAIGSRALLNNTTGGALQTIQGVDVGPNVAVGQQALESNTVASSNTAVGYQALHSFTNGPATLEQIGLCTAVGFQALANANGDAFANNAFGYHALMNNTIGSGNTAIGLQALLSTTDGAGNVAIGNNALSNSTGDSNTAVGFNAGAAVTTANNLICIGAFGANVDNSCYIGNVFGQPGGAQAVFVNSDGKLGAQVSSRRFKEEIKPMAKVSEALYALKPVAFRYKKEIDSTRAAQLGLVAEEVEKVSADLVIHDKQGKPYSVRYDQVNAMLLNEFLKEHATMQELKEEIATLKAGFQELSDQLKMSRTVQLAENRQ